MFHGTTLWQQRIPLKMIRYTPDSGKTIETFPDLPENLYAALVKSAKAFPQKNAFIDNYGRIYTFSDFKSKVDLFAGYLKHNIGVTRGNHVAIMFYNSIEFCVAFLALIKLGAVTVPMPTKFKQAEILSLLKHSDIDHIICDEHFHTWFSDYENSGITVISAPDTEAGYAFTAYEAPEYTDEKCDSTSGEQALLMFTSGTTSQSKGVIIKNYNIMHAVKAYQLLLGITEKDISVIATPIYHVTGLIALLGLFIYTGGTLYLHKFFDARRVLDCVKKNGITFIHASPTVFSMLLSESSHFPELPSLKSLACGSSNMPAGKLHKYHEWLPDMVFHTVYGLTETSSPATIFPGNACTSKYIGSSGLPIPGTVFKILDESGNEMPAGKVGEIWISGSVVLESYYKLQTDSLKNGWLGTGDLGYITADGYLYVVDRKKDMINRGGEKIWSFDVENELYQIPGVEEAAVVGIPDEVYGEVAVAAVKKEPDAHFTEQELKDILRTRIAKYKVPAHIIFMNKIPETPNGKIDKKNIRQLFTEKTEGGKS